METDEHLQTVPPKEPVTPPKTDNTATAKERPKSKKGRKQLPLIGALVLVLVIGILAASMTGQLFTHKNPEIVTTSSLEKIIKVSRLSTYGAVYNGIAQVANDEDPEKIDYYVSYGSDITVNMDVSQIKPSVDSENRIITILLPKMNIDVEVDISSMDYIFMDEDAETPTVSAQAYEACIADAQSECEQEMDIFLLAQKNAEKTVNALLEPLLSGLEQDYTVDLQWEA